MYHDHGLLNCFPGRIHCTSANKRGVPGISRVSFKKLNEPVTRDPTELSQKFDRLGRLDLSLRRKISESAVSVHYVDFSWRISLEK